MRRTRFWYKCSEGLVNSGPIGAAVTILAVAILAYPWLALLELSLLATVLLTVVVGNLVMIGISGFFIARHRRMADLYMEATLAGLHRDWNRAGELKAKADSMRWVA